LEELEVFFPDTFQPLPEDLLFLYTFMLWSDGAVNPPLVTKLPDGQVASAPEVVFLGIVTWVTTHELVPPELHKQIA
jgi:hypothetical protein